MQKKQTTTSLFVYALWLNSVGESEDSGPTDKEREEAKTLIDVLVKNVMQPEIEA